MKDKNKLSEKEDAAKAAKEKHKLHNIHEEIAVGKTASEKHITTKVMKEKHKIHDIHEEDTADESDKEKHNDNEKHSNTKAIKGKYTEDVVKKDDLITQVYEKFLHNNKLNDKPLSFKSMKSIIETFIEEIKGASLNHTIKIVNFGTISVRQVAPRTVIPPKRPGAAAAKTPVKLPSSYTVKMKISDGWKKFVKQNVKPSSPVKKKTNQTNNKAKV